MDPYYSDNLCDLYCGDSRSLPLQDETIQCCVTSPPYFGLRDYGTGGQIGIEKTPAEYVSAMLSVFREVKRVLRDDGTLWLNLGDSYSNDGKWGGHTGGKHVAALHGSMIGRNKRYTGLKPKDLIGIPWRVAFALQEDGWYLRSDIIWHKPNPMPESVTDRPTKSHEYLFLLAKSEKYFYDADAIKETSTWGGELRPNGNPRTSRPKGSFNGKTEMMADTGQNAFRAVTEFRNKRSVWTVASQPYAGAHFATFPPTLIEPCIKAGSSPGDIVLDPFNGSGTTGAVCRKWGRKYVGIDLNQEYLELSKDRFRQGVLFGAEPGGAQE